MIPNSCNAVEGGWAATGVITNPGPKKGSYTVTVYFTTPTATVIGTAIGTAQTTELLRRFQTAELVVFYAARAGCS